MADRGVSGVPTVVLASGSPRRAAILRRLGIEPDVRPTDVDETVRVGESAADLVERLAIAKLTACAHVPPPSSQPVLIIAADTVVEVGGSILGKPEGKADVERMLALLSGRRHRVITGLAVGLFDPTGDGTRLRQVSAQETTAVTFRTLDRDLTDWYVRTGEAFDKAGAYGIQGRGSLLVDRVEGSYLNVVGLPVVALDELCRSIGWPLHRFADRPDGAATTTARAGVVA
jgi:septum formation protein